VNPKQGAAPTPRYSGEAILAATEDSLHEAYSALQGVNQFLRELMFKVASGAMGAILVADGWFVSRSPAPDFRTRVALTIGFVLITLVAIYSVAAHYQEYLASAAMIVRVERALGFYDESRFLAGETLYKQASKEWGTGRFSRHILRTYLTGILLITGVSLTVVWFL
jgi:hypothetical protein